MLRSGSDRVSLYRQYLIPYIVLRSMPNCQINPVFVRWFIWLIYDRNTQNSVDIFAILSLLIFSPGFPTLKPYWASFWHEDMFIARLLVCRTNQILVMYDQNFLSFDGHLISFYKQVFLQNFYISNFISWH